MASMLLRASRDAVRVAASVASRCAAAAAVSNRLLRRSPIASPALGRGLCSHGGFLSSPCRAMSSSLAPKGRVKFVADAKDLESDEALWALYERWCEAFGAKRSREEMLRRFDHFKRTVLHVDRFNKEAIQKGESGRLGINMFSDGKLAESVLGGGNRAKYMMSLPYSKTVIYGRPPLEGEELLDLEES